MNQLLAYLEAVGVVVGVLAPLALSLVALAHSLATARAQAVHELATHGLPDPAGLLSDVSALYLARRQGLATLAAALQAAIDASRALGDTTRAAELATVAAQVGAWLSELESSPAPTPTAAPLPAMGAVPIPPGTAPGVGV